MFSKVKSTYGAESSAIVYCIDIKITSIVREKEKTRANERKI